VDGSGNVYVSDRQNNVVQKFDSNGSFLMSWGAWGSGDGYFHDPKGIAVDDSGNVYVADYTNKRIQKFGGG
jgi:tripartite motif-containing protein 71